MFEYTGTDDLGNKRLQAAKARLNSVMQNTGQSSARDNYTDATDEILENDPDAGVVDDDVSCMLENLRKYDKLNESLISGMANISNYRKKVVKEDETTAEDVNTDDTDDESITEDDDNGQPDPEIMEWIARFNKLGR